MKGRYLKGFLGCYIKETPDLTDWSGVDTSNISSAQEEVRGLYHTCLPLPSLAHAAAGTDPPIWRMEQVHPWLVLLLQLVNRGENTAASSESNPAKGVEGPRRELALTGPCCSIY